MENIEILRKLVSFESPVLILKDLLKTLPWDSCESIIMKREYLTNVILRLRNGEITEHDFIEWANMIECREDIEFEDDEMVDAIFSIANPELVGKEYIRNLINSSLVG